MAYLLFEFIRATAALASGPAAFPPVLCASPQEVLVRIESCTDNEQAYQAAATCLERTNQEWKKAAKDLSGLLALAQPGYAQSQQAKLLNSEQDLGRSIATLSELVAMTDNNIEVIKVYPRVMIDNPYAKSLSRSSRCYRNVFHKLVDIAKELRQKVNEGKAAQAAASQLRSVAGARDESLGTTSRQGGGKVVYSTGGASENGRSDVTGLVEDEKKRGAYLEPTPWSQKVHAQKLGQPKDDISTVTRAEPNPTRDFRNPGLGEKLDPSGTFSGRGSLQKESPLAAAREKDTGTGSVGAALFGSTLGLEEELAMSKASLPGAQDEGAPPAAELFPAGGVKPLGEIAAFAGSRGPASVAYAAASPEAAAEAKTLFAQVSARYKRTELFRKAGLPGAALTAELAR